MFDLDRWNEVFATLSKNKLRTFLTAIGVGWGIFMLVVMLAASKGLENGVSSQFRGFASNSAFMWAQSTTIPYKGLPRNRWYRFNNDDVEAIRNEVDGLKAFAPRNQLGGYRGNSMVTRGTISQAFNIYGDYPEVLKIQEVDVYKGRFINELDIKYKRKTCVVGQRVVDVLFKPDEDPIGEYINVSGVYFQIVGVFKSQKSGERADDETKTVHIPFTSFQQGFNFGNDVGWFAVLAEDDYQMTDVEADIRTVIKRRHKLHPDDDAAIGSFNAQEAFQKMRMVFIGIDSLTIFVGLLTLLAGVIGVSNIMLIIIKERTKEIGIRRAIGASPNSIRLQIILESITLTTIAGYSGLVLAVFLVEMVAKFVQHDFFKNPEIDFNIAFNSLVILIIAGALAGIMPASKAKKVKPIDALRTE